jgi:alpha-amylase
MFMGVSGQKTSSSLQVSAAAVLVILVAFTIACASLAPSARPVAPERGAVADVERWTRVEPHSGWAEAIVYFAIVDRFADGDSTNNATVDRSAKGAFHGGDLQGLTQQLDELADLGVTALWITPVVKNMDGFVTGAGFPDWGYHGYWADDFNRLDPRFGSEEDLKALVDAAHDRGIAVLLDVVYNHVGYESGYLEAPETRDWLRTENLGTCGQDDLTSCVGGLPDLKTERPEIREHLFAAHLGLAERVGLDGFRLDTVKHVTHDFWREHRERCRARLDDEFFLLGEVWGGDRQVLDPWFAGDEMDAGFDFSFQGSVIGFLQRRGRPVAFNRYLERRHEVREGFHLSHYLSTHDTPGALYQLGGDVELFSLAAVLQFTTFGIPTIYYGEEVARAGGDWPENRSDMPWGNREILPGRGLERDESLREQYKRLIAIRRAHPALWRGGHEGVQFDSDLLVFLRRDDASGDAVVVAVNRGDEAALVSFEKPALWGGVEIRDIWNDEIVAADGDDRVEVAIEGLSTRILAGPESM